jgi:hypothetical protein
MTSGKLIVTGNRTLNLSPNASTSQVTGFVALDITGNNTVVWNLPSATNGNFFVPIGIENGPVNGNRPITFSNLTTPAGSPSMTFKYAANPGTPTNSTSVSNTADVIQFYLDVTTAGGSFGNADLTMECDLTTDFFTLPAPDAGDLDIYRARFVAPLSPWDFLGALPFPGVNGSNTTITQPGMAIANGLNRFIIGQSDNVHLGTPQAISWTGIVNNNWNNQANWSPSIVPTLPQQRVTIPNTTRKPVYTGPGITLRAINIALGATVTINGNFGLDSTLNNNGTLTVTGLFTNSGNGFGTGIFNISGTTGVNNLGGWLITNTSASGVVVASPSQSFVLSDSLKLNGTGKLDLNGASLTLNSNAVKTAKIGTIPTTATLSGASNVTWKRYVPSVTSGWYFLGTPIQSQTLSNWGDNFNIFLPIVLPNVYFSEADRATVFTFDGTASPINGPEPAEVNGWRIATLPGTVAVGQGYRTFLKDIPFLTGPKKFYDNTGTVTQGDFTFTTTFNASGYNGGGWNFLANPYPAAINWDAPTNGTNWTKTNVNNAIYIWNGANGQYMSYVGGSGGVGVNGGTNIIPSGQAFTVKVNSGAVLTARENVKFSGSGSFARVATNNALLKIKLKDQSGRSDENILRSMAGGTFNFDSDLDAYKLDGQFLNLAILTEQYKLSIQTIGELEPQFVIPLSVRSVSTGIHTLEFQNLSEFLGEHILFIKDNYLSTISQVTENQLVEFELNADPASQADSRFELVFMIEEVTSVKTTSKMVYSLFPNPAADGRFVIEASDIVKNASVSITDVTGKEVLNITLSENQRSWKFNTDLKPGVYFVKFRSDRGTFSQKLSIN